MFIQRAVSTAMAFGFVSLLTGVSAQEKPTAAPDSATKSGTPASRAQRPPRPFPLFPLGQMAEVLSYRDIDRPLTWPATRRWAPRRYFGPIFGASPNLRLHGSTATFLYGRYFNSLLDASFFAKYYGANLPSGAEPQGERVPGVVSGDGFYDVILNLEQLNYSSRYGGSFKLSFLSTEDSGVEYRSSTAAWDIGSLAMDVYVKPVASYFNRGPLLQFQIPEGDVHVEFAPRGVVGYHVGAGNTLTLDTSDPRPALTTALEAAARSLTGPTGSFFRLDAARLSYGLVHTEFAEDIGNSSNVDSILISDGLFIPTTSAQQPLAC